MRKDFSFPLLGALLILSLASCGLFFPDPNANTLGYAPSKNSVTLVGSGVQAADFILELGAEQREVYFVFSNSSSISAPMPNIRSVSKSIDPALSQDPPSSEGIPSGAGPFPPEGRARALRGNPAASEFNANPPPVTRSGRSIRARELEAPPGHDTVGASVDFIIKDWKDNSAARQVPSTCRGASVNESSMRALNIYVADDCWEGSSSSKAYKVDQTMVDSLVSAFLRNTATAGEESDGIGVYGWTKGLIGPEWGDTGAENLISFDGKITILLYDIDEDNSVDGGSIGYFHSKDNYLKAPADGSIGVSSSNERIMLYLDAVLFAIPSDKGYVQSQSAQTDSEWALSDYWPSEILLTSAHELQHMVSFYKRWVLGGFSTQTWLNEMCSLVVEDFLTARLAEDLRIPVLGPRGIRGDSGGAGEGGNSSGRIPVFNYNPAGSLTQWNNDASVVLESYARSYSFGAYLARNYGGASFLERLMSGAKGTVDDVVSAAAVEGTGPRMPELLLGWGAAVLLSDSTSAETPYSFNKSGFFSDSGGNLLGSINFHNYYRHPPDAANDPSDVYPTGPLALEASALTDDTKLAPGSMALIRFCSASGTLRFTLSELSESVRAAIVVR